MLSIGELRQLATAAVEEYWERGYRPRVPYVVLDASGTSCIAARSPQEVLGVIQNLGLMAAADNGEHWFTFEMGDDGTIIDEVRIADFAREAAKDYQPLCAGARSRRRPGVEVEGDTPS